MHYNNNHRQRNGEQQMNVIRNTVTGQYLCDFDDDGITGRGKNSIPVWGDVGAAMAASVEALAKCHLAGIFVVEVAFLK
jgi:hypothetical protein